MTRCRSSAIGGGLCLFGALDFPLLYPIALTLWAATFMEYWKVVERKISVW